MNVFGEIFKLVRSKLDSRSVSELGWVFAGQVTTVLLSFVIVKILSGMGAANYGVYALVITVAVLAGLLFHGPVAQGFLRFYYHYLEKSTVNIFIKVIYSVLIISSAVFLVLSLVVFAISPLFKSNQPAVFFLLAGIFIITSKVNEFFNSVLNLIRKRKQNSLLQSSEKALTIILLFLLIRLNGLMLPNVFLVLAFITFSFAAIKISVFNKFRPAEESHTPAFIKETHVPK